MVFKTKPSLELTSPRRPFTVTQRLQFPYFLSFEGKHHPVKEYTYCFSFSFFFSYFFCVDNPDVLILFTYLYLFSLCPTATNLRYFHLSSSIDSKYHPLIPDPKYSSSVNAHRHLSLSLSLSLKSHVYLSGDNKEIAGVWVVKFSQIKNLWILVVELWPQLPTIRTSKWVSCTHKWVCINLSYFTRPLKSIKSVHVPFFGIIQFYRVKSYFIKYIITFYNIANITIFIYLIYLLKY